MNNLLNVALDYVSRGWYVFPCRERPSRPYEKEGQTYVLAEKTPYTAHGLNDASNDPDQIRIWWNKYPEAMIGVNAGKSGLFVVDIDKKHVNGLDTFQSWNINDSAGLHSMTPSGGMHIVFTGKGKSSTNAKTGIDTRGEGGYFIIPPSKIIDGEYVGEYKYIDDWGKTPGVIPDGLMTKIFPQDTTEYVRGEFTGGKKQLSRNTLNFFINGSPEGERNTTLFKVFADFNGCGYTREDARETVMPVCQRIGLTEMEVDTVLDHAYSKPRTSSIPDEVQQKILTGGKNIASQITNEEEAIIETVLLSCLLVDNNLIPAINDILGFDDFRVLKNRLIYRAINRIHASGKKADYITVSNEITSETDKVSMDDISRMINQYFVNTDNVMTYANIIREKSSIRKLESLMDNKEKYLQEKNISEVVYKLEKDIADIAVYGGINSTNILTAEQATNLVSEQIRKMNAGEIEQLKTGFTKYDNEIGGLYSNELVICAGRAGEGKCLKKGTLVIMHNGSMKKVEDIVIGDKLMGVDSKPRTVLALSTGTDMLYTVKQNRAQNYTVNSKHILSLKESSTGKNINNGDIMNISIIDYMKLSKRRQMNLKGYKASVEFPKKELPLEPYMLGIWLGDGASRKAMITSADEEIISYIYDFAKRNAMGVSSYKQRDEDIWADYSISGGLKALLRDLGVLENKHIPFDYLTSSKEDRLDLLAGIIDTDGSVAHNGYEITQKNRELLKQVKWLADSLGFRTSPIKEKICTIKSTGFGGIYYRITIHGQMSLLPVRINRKKIPYINKRINQAVTGIQVIEDGVGEYYGFEIDQDGLFLLEDFTVTHNSALALSILNHVALVQRKPCVMFTLEMSTHETVCRLVCQLTGLPFKDVYPGRLKGKEWDEYTSAMDKIAKSNLYIDDTFGITIPELRSKIRKLMEKDIKLVVIDQLEQIKGYDGLPAYQRYDNIAYDIKNLTQEFNVPILLNHQLNRNITDRKLKNPEPQLSDLNQAGEKPANQVWIISHKKDEQTGEIQFSKIKMLKNRNGARIEFAVRFVGERMLFANPATESEEYVFHSEGCLDVSAMVDGYDERECSLPF